MLPWNNAANHLAYYRSVIFSYLLTNSAWTVLCCFQILVDIINNDNLGDTIIRSRIWIPNCFRIITASLTSVECRSWIIRTPRFLNGRCINDLDQTNPDENLEVLWLDLLLSLTSFDVSFKVAIFVSWHFKFNLDNLNYFVGWAKLGGQEWRCYRHFGGKSKTLWFTAFISNS